MITSLVGPNMFMLSSELQKRRTDFVREHGDLALEVVDVAEWETRRVFDTLAAMPFLSPRRMVIMRGLAANKQASEQIEQLLTSASDTTDVLLVEPKIDKRSVLYKTLKKSTDWHEFSEADARSLPQWVAALTKSSGGTISSANAAYLVNRVGSNQLMLSNEIAKLLLYKPEITRENIELLTEQAPQSTVFELIEAAFAGNVVRAMHLYQDQRQQNVEPIAIEALFVWQLHALVLCKAAGSKTADEIAAQSGISPYVAKKSVQLAHNRSMAQIKHYVHELAELEQALKSVSVDADELMQNFILLLAQ